MRPPTTEFRPVRRYLLLAALLLIGLYVLVPQLGDFRSSWHLLRHPLPAWTAAAIGLTALTYLAGAATYCLLAFKPLRYGQVVAVQLAAMFVNRLLPVGIGALGTNYAYLRRERHSPVQAASVVAVNNLLGVLGHAVLVAVTLAVFWGRVSIAPGHHYSLNWLPRAIAGLVLLLVVLVWIFGRRKLARKAADIRGQLLSYRQRPRRLPAALVSSMFLTLCNVFCLLCCGLALGIHLPFAVILLIFSLGIGAGTATPTPGGLGGFEAGLAAGFIAYHVGSSSALAAALLYRLVSYWLPLLAGGPAFFVCQKQHLFSTDKQAS